MSDSALNRLERQIDALLQEYDRQKQHNLHLRNKQEDLIVERNELREKLKLAVVGIKKIIQRVKAIEAKS